MRQVIVVLICLQSAVQSFSQIKPAEGRELNYRIIDFEFPAVNKIKEYKLEVADCNCLDDKSFTEHIIQSGITNTNNSIVEVPSFSSSYTWRVSAIKSRFRTELHHFRTGDAPVTDTSLFRLRMLHNSGAYKDAYVFIDATRGLYDMRGNLVWYLQMPDGVNIRDLKLSADGSITYVIDEAGIYEICYTGDTLWKGPNDGKVSGDNNEHYHHEFTKLNNGNYMALGQDFRYWKKPANEHDNHLVILDKPKADPETDTQYVRNPMGTLIEYNKNSEVVWSWKSSDHLNGSDIFYMHGKGQFHAHENSFFFDEERKFIYLSCRNLNCIIKINYPDGTIACIYHGEKYNHLNSGTNNLLFCGQHSCRISHDGNLYFYNNNTCNAGDAPKIQVVKEPEAANASLETVWEFQCPAEQTGIKSYPSGGNVMELDEQLYFVSMAYPGSDLFIADKERKILWSTHAEKWNKENRLWEPLNIYRASIITDKAAFERMIRRER